MTAFEFPPLGPTGEGDPPYPGMRGIALWARHDQKYYVVHQGDRPAVAFRCWIDSGRAGYPCDEATARRFIEWAKEQP